jgi:hypothetical protein
MASQLGYMEEGINAAKRGDMNAGSQAVLITFQRILDPTSVVRESEYARSSSGLSMLNRMQGMYDKVVSGGAGVPAAQLEEFARLARTFVSNAKRTADHASLPILLSADDLGIDRSRIATFDQGPADAGGGNAPPAPPKSNIKSARPGG